MTTANKITILRILLVPFFIVQMIDYEQSGDEFNRLLALVSFAVAAMSDGLDGYIARRYHQRSELGAVLDPLADKFLLVSGIILLSVKNPHLEQIPIWLTGTVVGRDLIILIGMSVIHYTLGKIAVRTRLIGKISTVLQMVVVLWLLLKWSSNWARVWMISAAFSTGLSGILYLFDGIKQLNASPSSAAAKKQP